MYGGNNTKLKSQILNVKKKDIIHGLVCLGTSPILGGERSYDECTRTTADACS